MALLLLCYACAAVFAAAVAARAVRILRLPRHLRWELYPVAHEAGRARYGGSYYEDPDWWTRPRKKSRLGQLAVMVPEILVLAGVRRHNRSLWWRSLAFHLGLYAVGAATLLLLADGIAGGLPAGGAIAALSYAGFGLGAAGAGLLLLRRATDPDYREYTTAAAYVNLGFISVALAAALVAQATGDADFTRMRGFFGDLMSFGLRTTGAGLTALQGVEVVLLSLLLAWIPLTHMSHFFTKWFMYHDIRWGDEPLRPGSRLERDVEANLARRPGWAAPHVGADGRRTWGEIASGPGGGTEDPR